MVAQVAAAAPEAIAILCTNLDGATAAARWEQDFGIPIYDTIAVSLYGALQVVGIDHSPLRRFGQLFA